MPDGGSCEGGGDAGRWVVRGMGLMLDGGSCHLCPAFQEGWGVLLLPASQWAMLSSFQERRQVGSTPPSRVSSEGGDGVVPLLR